jgi:hypothetical protein
MCILLQRAHHFRLATMTNNTIHEVQECYRGTCFGRTHPFGCILFVFSLTPIVNFSVHIKLIADLVSSTVIHYYVNDQIYS